MHAELNHAGKKMNVVPGLSKKETWVGHTYSQKVKPGEPISLHKFGGYTVSRNHKSGSLVEAADRVLDQALELGFDDL